MVGIKQEILVFKKGAPARLITCNGGMDVTVLYVHLTEDLSELPSHAYVRQAYIKSEVLARAKDLIIDDPELNSYYLPIDSEIRLIPTIHHPLSKL